MSWIKRRQFLQFAGSTLATLGLSHLDIILRGDRYARVLAQNTPRKLALLVGINAYPFNNELAGCLTDVELQRHLLINRFGFNPNDILILTDQAKEKPTRQTILTAFEQHLIKQAKPGDVVVFHFSGHGSRVSDSDCIYKDKDGTCLNSTFVPLDNTLSLEARENGGVVSDISGHTLFLLMSALNTENVTFVLDSCHSGGGKRGNLTMRNVGGGSQLKVSPVEIEYQQQWCSKLNLSPETYKQQLKSGVAKGVVIASAGIDQLAADAPFSGFKAGAFTYMMTQYLWQETGDEPLESAIANIGRSTTQVSGTRQVPENEVKPNSNNAQQPIYFLREQTPPAEAVITKVEGDGVELWLGGLNSESIRGFDKGAILTLVDTQGKEQGLVQLESRQGLTAHAKPLKDIKRETLKVGALLQERVRVIPTDVTLRIGLDSSLGNDKAKAEQGLKGIKQIAALPVQQGKEVGYILGCMTQDNRQFQKASGEELPSVGSIGLFTPALELIPSSFGAVSESVEAAITRLKAKFKSLLAVHLVKMILNPGSSRLRVVASMNLPESGNEIVASTFAVRGGAKAEESVHSTRGTSGNFQQLRVGTRLQFKVTNQENRDLHVSLLVIDPEGAMTVIFPNSWTTTDEATLVKAGESLLIPVRGKDAFKLTVEKPLGMVEILVIASAAPLRESLQALQKIASRGQQARGLPLSLTDDDPKAVIDSLLVDLDRRTRGGVGVSADESVRGVDAKQLAAMSITFESIAT